MRRMLCCAVPLTLLCIAVSAAPVSLVCSDVQNGNLTVSVMLAENSNIAAGSLDLVYDNTVLTVNDAAAGDLAVDANPIINPSFSADTVRFVWCGIGGIRAGGELLRVTFRVTDDTAAQTTVRVPVFKAETSDGVRIKPIVEDAVCRLTDAGRHTVAVTAPDAASAGSTVTVTVGLPAGTDEAAGRLILSYDNTLLRLLSVSAGDVLDGYNPIVNPQYTDSSVCLVWSSAGSGQTSAGTLLEASFEVTAPTGGKAVFALDGRMTDALGRTIDAVYAGAEMTLNANFTLTLDPNDGSGKPTKQTVSGGTAVKLTYCIRNYYLFLGWSASPTATEATFAVDETVTVTEDMTLYGVWLQPTVAILTIKSFGTDISTTVRFDDSIPDGALLVLAYYDADGRVVLTKMMTISGRTVKYSFENKRDLASPIVHAEAFVFDSVINLTPLAPKAGYNPMLIVM